MWWTASSITIASGGSPGSATWRTAMSWAEARPQHPAKPEQDPLLVLLDDPRGHRQPQQDQHHHDGQNDYQDFHNVSIQLSG
jgi:hypothetical protein